MDESGSVALIVMALAAYLLPWFVASARKHNNSSAIALFTLLLGWTGIGWVAALIWASTDNVRKTVARTREAPPGREAMKRCPFCAEEVLAAAKKCKHCGSEITA